MSYDVSKMVRNQTDQLISPIFFAGNHDDGSQAVLKDPETSFESALTSLVSFRYDLKHSKILNLIFLNSVEYPKFRKFWRRMT